MTGEEMTFEEAIEETSAVRTQLFRHSRFPYGAALQLSRDIYNYSAIQGPACMMFSWIPVPSLGARAQIAFTVQNPLIAHDILDFARKEAR